MNVMRLAVTTALLVLSFQAAADDAGRCAETRRNIARLEDNLRKAATDSDRLAYQQSLSAYRMAEPGICGTGPSASGPRATPPGANSPAANAAALLGPVLGALQSVPLDAAAYMPARTGPTLPSPPTPSGSVTGPMTLQRLGGPSVSTATVNTPRVHTLEPSVPSPFPTDQQLRARCSRSGNPDFCLLDLQTQRDRDPAYLRWKAQESARMDRNIDASLANVHATVAAQSARNAGPTIAVPVIAAARPTIPVAPPPMPYDNSDPDLARCREGARTPETIAGCYDLGRGPSARQAAPRPSLRDRLKKALDALPDTIALPFRDTAPAESEYDTRWQPAAEAQLREAIRNGKTVVAENRSARAACQGAWYYDGLSEGECLDHPSRVVYAVDVPQETQAQAQPVEDQPREREGFTMGDPEETEREIRRLLQPLEAELRSREPQQFGPPEPEQIGPPLPHR